jgi:hypothetical protein
MGILLPVTLGTLAVLSSLVVLYSAQLKGFPDGYLTPLFRAARPLYYLYCVAGLVFGGWLLYLGWISRRKSIWKRFLITIAVFVVLVFLLLSEYWYLSSFLDNGTGG